MNKLSWLVALCAICSFVAALVIVMRQSVILDNMDSLNSRIQTIERQQLLIYKKLP